MEDIVWHVESMASLCAEPSSTVSRVTITECLGASAASAVRRVVPAIAARYRLVGWCETRDGLVTVSFRRQTRRSD